MTKEFKLEMPFSEALERLSRVPKPRSVDLKERRGKTAGATNKQRRHKVIPLSRKRG